MAGMLEHLDTEAALLMYLADELAEADRAQFERTLAADPALRDRLQELVRIYDQLREQLDGLGSANRPVNPEAGIGRLLRKMRRYEQQLAQRRQTDEIAGAARQRLPRWAYVAIGVAASIVFLLGLWGIGVFELPGEKPRVANMPPTDRPDSRPDRISDSVKRFAVSAPKGFSPLQRTARGIATSIANEISSIEAGVCIDNELQRSFANVPGGALDEADVHFRALQAEDDDPLAPSL